MIVGNYKEGGVQSSAKCCFEIQSNSHNAYYLLACTSYLQLKIQGTTPSLSCARFIDVLTRVGVSNRHHLSCFRIYCRAQVKSFLWVIPLSSLLIYLTWEGPLISVTVGTHSLSPGFLYSASLWMFFQHGCNPLSGIWDPRFFLKRKQ